MTAVKYYTNLMQGAPQLANTWGCMIPLLDACLVTGFNEAAVSSISRVGNIATVSIDAGHSYQVNQVLAIAGADQIEYNGEFRVLSVTATTFTCTITGTPVTPSTGAAITVKVAPLGFEKVFSGTDKGVYRSKNVLSNRPYLRVDNSKAPQYNDTWAKKARVGIAQNMSDIDTVVGAQAPYDPLLPNKNWETTGDTDSVNVVDGWYQWYYARRIEGYDDRTPPANWDRPWVLVGDDRGFYLFNEQDLYANDSVKGRGGYCFTDFDSYRQSDSFNTLLAASDFHASVSSGPPAGGAATYNNFNRSLDFTGKILMRDHTLLGGNQRVGITSLNTNNGQTVSGRVTGIPFPNPVDNSLILHPTFLMQESGKGLRGKLPGLMWVHNDNPLQDLGIVENVAGYADRKFLMIRMNTINEGASSVMALDITGPWW